MHQLSRLVKYSRRSKAGANFGDYLFRGLANDLNCGGGKKMGKIGVEGIDVMMIENERQMFGKFV